jgi:IS5 family transposase
MFKDCRNWKIENEKYVRRGELLLDFDFLDRWDYEIRKMNSNRWGGKYLYPDSFITALSFIYVLFFLPYRQLEGFFKAISKFIPNLKVPDHSTIHRRVNKLNINLKESLIKSKVPVVLAVDSSGIKVAKSGDWIRKTWKVRKGWLKIHFAVDTKTKQIVALEVTDERVGDIKKFKKLVRKSSKTKNVEKVLADSAYDSNENYKFLNSKNIVAGIKPKCVKGRIRSGKMSNKERRRVASAYLKDEKSWKASVGYGMRWTSETVFSTFKRIFGECISAKKFQNMVKEIQLKVFALNYLITYA